MMGQTPPHDPSASVTANIELAGPDWQLRVKMAMPAGPTRVRELLPTAQAFTDAVVDSAVKMAAAQGLTVSCKAGCGACCRQLVPIAEAEARHIRELVEGLPEPRRTAMRERFAEARRRLEAAGLLDKLLNRDQWADGEGQTVGMAYFDQGIPCPFLENESCSIHADRPMVCREYLVTSPADRCALPAAETVDCLKLPLKVWTAVARLAPVPPSARYISWVPLVLAPEWAGAHPDEPPPRPGPDLVRDFFDHVTGKRQPQTQQVQLPFDPDPLSASAHEEARG